MRRTNCCRDASGPSVLILVENLPVPFDRRVWQEAKTLVRVGYHVHVVCPKPDASMKKHEISDGIHIHRYWPGREASNILGYVGEYGVALLSMLYLALRIGMRHRISVVQACNPPDILFVIALAFKIFQGSRFVFDHHDLCPELLLAKGRKPGGVAVKVASILERITFQLADTTIATNESYAEIARSRGRVREEDVFVVRSGVDVARVRRSTLNDKYFNGREHLIAYVGVMGAQEGIDYLLAATRTIVHTWGRRDIQVVLAGDGPDRRRLEKCSTELLLRDYVTFVGRVSDDELMSILSSATVCVNPDEVNLMNNLSTMNKILEYMALGKPIVQFEVKEGRFSAGESSAYAKPNDATSLAEELVRVIDSPDLQAKMGHIGICRLRNLFTWEKQETALLAAYANALEDRAQMTAAL